MGQNPNPHSIRRWAGRSPTAPRKLDCFTVSFASVSRPRVYGASFKAGFSRQCPLAVASTIAGDMNYDLREEPFGNHFQLGLELGLN